jgi:hypothetical protein
MQNACPWAFAQACLHGSQSMWTACVQAAQLTVGVG